MDDQVMTVLVLIGAVTLASQWLAWRLQLPAILFLLIGGVLLGPTTGILRPDELLGDILFPFVSLAVATILFEGSLTLRRAEIAGHGAVVRNLVTVGPLITWVLVALVTHFATGASWPIAILFGAIMTVTGPTVIAPMIKAVRPARNIASILRWEGILIDPVGAILAVLAYNVIIAQQASAAFDTAFLLLVKLLLSGLLLGAGGGYLWGTALRRYWIPQYLQSIATLLIMLIVYLAAERVEHESGLLAVTVMGVWLANMPDVHIEEILDFKERLSILLISALFILLAARLEFAQILAVGWPALLVVLGLQFVARPAKVLLCSIGSKLSLKERLLLAWIGPRGIIAAAISALFALRLESRGFEDAELLVPLAFIVIAGTVLLQSATARPLALLLKLGSPAAEGILFIGGNPFSLAMAAALQKHDFRVVIASSNWNSLRQARMAGIETYYGNPLSQHAEQHLDMTGIGKLFGTSMNAAFNDLVCSHFSSTLGRKNVFWLPISVPESDAESGKHAMTEEWRGRRLFSTDQALTGLIKRVADGAVIRTTKLSEDFDYDAFREQLGPGDLPLAAWTPGGTLLIYATDSVWTPQPGWTIATLTTEAEQSDRTPAEQPREAGSPAV
ncbi:MAG: sodium:proton antiporter [Gammaproteobacteria bacterium]|nr:sodium:proton antiporter [Gammaproteobacteria bacterium]